MNLMTLTISENLNSKVRVIAPSHMVLSYHRPVSLSRCGLGIQPLSRRRFYHLECLRTDIWLCPGYALCNGYLLRNVLSSYYA